MTGQVAEQPASLLDILMDFGFAEVKAEIWARFLEEAIGILDQAGRELRGADAWSDFIGKRGALSTPKRRRKTGTFERAPIEDGITAELGHIARRLRVALPIGHFLRLQDVAFETEHLVESDTRTGRHSRKVDFFIYSQIGEGAPELAIEAKPLREPTDITGRYLAEEGIGCFFSSDSVYTQQPVAGMLAYTINTKSLPHLQQIQTALAAYIHQPLALAQIALPATGVLLLCSRHERAVLSLGPVTIVHFEMLFEPEISSS